MNDERQTVRPFNPMSHDAMFATVLTRLDAQDVKLDQILRHAEKTNGRVTALEHWKDLLRAKAGLISAGVSTVIAFAGWMISRL